MKWKLTIYLLSMLAVMGMVSAIYENYSLPTVYYNQSIAGVTVYGITAVPVLALNVPLEANSKYLMIFSGRVNGTTGGSNNIVYMYRNGTSFIQYQANWRMLSEGNPQQNDYLFHAWIAESTTAKSYTYNVTIIATNASAYFTLAETQIYAIRLDNITNGQLNYSAVQQTTNIDNVFGDDAGDRTDVSLTPNATGEYLVIGTGLWGSGSTSSSVSGRLYVDATTPVPNLSSGGAFSYGRIEDSQSGNFFPFAQVYLHNVTSLVQHNYSLQFADIDTTASADIRNLSLIVFRLKDNLPFYYAEDMLETNVTSTTLTTKGSLTIPIDKPANWLFLASTAWAGKTVSYDYILTTNLSGTQATWHKFRPKDALDYIPLVNVFNSTIGNSSYVFSRRHAREDATGTSSVKDSRLFAIAINWTKDASAPPADTCTCPGAGSNWAINLADHCVISSDCNITTGSLSVYGDGYFNISTGIALTAYTFLYTNFTAGDRINLLPNARIYFDR